MSQIDEIIENYTRRLATALRSSPDGRLRLLAELLDTRDETVMALVRDHVTMEWQGSPNFREVYGDFEVVRAGDRYGLRRVGADPYSFVLRTPDLSAIRQEAQRRAEDASRRASVESRTGPLPDPYGIAKQINRFRKLDSVRRTWGPGWDALDMDESALQRLAMTKLRPTYNARGKYRDDARRALDAFERLVEASAWPASQGRPEDVREDLAWVHAADDGLSLVEWARKVVRDATERMETRRRQANELFNRASHYVQVGQFDAAEAAMAELRATDLFSALNSWSRQKFLDLDGQIAAGRRQAAQPRTRRTVFALGEAGDLWLRSQIRARGGLIPPMLAPRMELTPDEADEVYGKIGLILEDARNQGVPAPRDVWGVFGALGEYLVANRVRSGIEVDERMAELRGPAPEPEFSYPLTQPEHNWLWRTADAARGAQARQVWPDRAADALALVVTKWAAHREATATASNAADLLGWLGSAIVGATMGAPHTHDPAPQGVINLARRLGEWCVTHGVLSPAAVADRLEGIDNATSQPAPAPRAPAMPSPGLPTTTPGTRGGMPLWIYTGSKHPALGIGTDYPSALSANDLTISPGTSLTPFDAINRERLKPYLDVLNAVEAIIRGDAWVARQAAHRYIREKYGKDKVSEEGLTSTHPFLVIAYDHELLAGTPDVLLKRWKHGELTPDTPMDRLPTDLEALWLAIEGDEGTGVYWRGKTDVQVHTDPPELERAQDYFTGAHGQRNQAAIVAQASRIARLLPELPRGLPRWTKGTNGYWSPTTTGGMFGGDGLSPNVPTVSWRPKYTKVGLRDVIASMLRGTANAEAIGDDMFNAFTTWGDLLEEFERGRPPTIALSYVLLEIGDVAHQRTWGEGSYPDVRPVRAEFDAFFKFAAGEWNNFAGPDDPQIDIEPRTRAELIKDLAAAVNPRRRAYKAQDLSEALPMGFRLRSKKPNAEEVHWTLLGDGVVLGSEVQWLKNRAGRRAMTETQALNLLLTAVLGTASREEVRASFRPVTIELQGDSLLETIRDGEGFSDLHARYAGHMTVALKRTLKSGPVYSVKLLSADAVKAMREALDDLVGAGRRLIEREDWRDSKYTKSDIERWARIGYRAMHDLDDAIRDFRL